MGPNDIQNELFVRLILASLKGEIDSTALPILLKNDEKLLRSEAKAAAEIAKILVSELKKTRDY